MAYIGRGGAFGEPRFGYPKTDAERLLEHRRMYPGKPLPPRSTGYYKNVGGLVEKEDWKPFIIGTIAGGLIVWLIGKIPEWIGG